MKPHTHHIADKKKNTEKLYYQYSQGSSDKNKTVLNYISVNDKVKQIKSDYVYVHKNYKLSISVVQQAASISYELKAVLVTTAGR